MWPPKRSDRGATAVEYGALILLVAALIVGLLAVGLPTELGGRTRQAACKVFSADCGPDGAGSAGQGAAAPRGESGAEGGGSSQVGSFFYNIGKAFVDELKGIGDLITDPGLIIDAAKYVYENPLTALRQLFWDDESRDMWDAGDIGGALGRTVYNVGTLIFSPAAILKLGKLGKVGKLGKLGKLGKILKGEKAGKAAREAAAARKAARKAARRAEAEAAAARKAGKKAGEPPPERSKIPCNSFVPGTEVLLADGTYRPIEKVGIGDRVLATDPATGLTRAQPVVDAYSGRSYRNLVQVIVDVDGARGSRTGAVVATEHHLFYDQARHAWTRADRLTSRSLLRLPEGPARQVVRVGINPGRPLVHDLTVAETHTYYVMAGPAPVLVHNCGRKVGYGRTDLSEAVQKKRLSERNKSNTYGAVRLKNGQIHVEHSLAGKHAERVLVEKYGKVNIDELYVELQPCNVGSNCRKLVQDIKKVTWSWPWPADENVRSSSRAARKKAVDQLFDQRKAGPIT